MISATQSASRLDPERLKYVTENFTFLQGLNWVAFGVAQTLSALSRLYLGNSHWGLVALLPWVLALVAMIRYIPRYYARRFGTVEQRSKPFDPSVKQIVLVMVGVFALWTLADVLRSFVTSASHIDPSELAWGVLFLFIARRLPRRRSLAAFFGVVAVTFALAPLLLDSSAHQLHLWKLLNATWTGVFFTLAGIWDHLTLVCLLPQQAGEA